MSQPTRKGSPLAQFEILSPNTNTRNGANVKFFIFHHAAGVISPRNLLNMARFRTNQFGKNGASCMYAIRDKEIGQGALETQRTWTSSSRWADEKGIAIEVANSRNDSADWPISDQSVQTAALLAVDCMRFYGYDTMAWYDDPNAMGMQNEMILKVHRMFQNTTCPGPWFMRNKEAFIDVVNALYQGKNARFVSIDSRTARCVVGDEANIEAAAPLPQPSAPIEAANTTQLTVGDIIQFAGGPHFVSATASSPAGNRTAGTARVTAIAAQGAQTVHLVGQPGGSNVHGWVDAKRVTKPGAPVPIKQDAPTPPTPVATQSTNGEFQVRVSVASLNVRRGPGDNPLQSIVGGITDRGIYTIVEEKGGWGRLKSGAGWVALRHTTRL